LAFLKRIACQGAPLGKAKTTDALPKAFVMMRAVAAAPAQ
jgi:hypothetical protein